MFTRSTLTTLALALAGGGMCVLSGSKLAENQGFDYQPNPLGIKRSPYGQVLAMAIQTPIDADWHGGLEIHDHAPGEACDHCDHSSHEGHDHDAHEGCDHEDHDHALASHEEDHSGHDHSDHDHSDHDCEGCGHDHGTESPAPKIALIQRLQTAVSARTNPNPPTLGHQFYLRQEIEKKLRFAYELDPSHYANYNCYHLFITQQSLGTHGLPQADVDHMVTTLADHTVRYCMTETSDPRPSLTAASAAYNVLERMLTADEGQFSFEEMHQRLGLMDTCIRHHFTLLDAAVKDGSFELLSSQRQSEILTRSKFTIKLRDSAQEAINRRENPQPATASTSS